MAREMKDSGIEWLGHIPKDWDVIAFWQAITRMGTGLNPRENFKLTKDDSLFYVTIRNFKDGKLYLDDNCDRISQNAWQIIQERSDLQKGDIIFASISKDGQAYILDSEPENWNINESVFCIRVNQNIFDNKFFYYHLIDKGYYDDLRMDATGSTFQSIKQNKLKKSRLVLPPLSEQRRIVSFLDSECSRIDSVIDQTRTSIEEYKKLKQSVITQAVTKGIRPGREMKDSGIEWIGRIPAEWRICKVKHIGYTQNGISKAGEYFGEGYPFVSYGDVYKNYSLPTKVIGLVQSTEEEQEIYSVKKGDIFFTRTSETIEEIGFSCVCEHSIPKATFAGFLIRVRPFDDTLDVGFSKYYFRSNHHRFYFVKQMNIVTRASLGQPLLKGLPVLVPEKDEQIEIAAYLDKECSEINNIIAAKENVVSELESYKKSLIYEYVTGKKEV